MRTKKDAWLDGWVKEGVALGFSIASLAATFALLGYFDRKPLADWRWSLVTLNTAIAVLATVSRSTTALVVTSCLGQFRWISLRRRLQPLTEFEVVSEATRGAWGGLKLLWITRSMSLVSMGAWLVILALLFDPFVQQIVSNEDAVVYSPEASARVPYASRWSAAEKLVTFIGLLDEDVGSFGDVLSTPKAHLEFSTQASIISGLSTGAEQIAQQLSATCSSGNCKWEGYRSLAVCSACNDVSNPMRSGRRTNIADQAAWFADSDGVNTAVNITWFLLPGNGLNMNNPVDYSYSKGSTERITMSGQANRQPATSIKFENSSTLLFSMAVMWANLGPDFKYANWSGEEIHAIECGLYLCAKEFNTTMSNGTIHETSREVASERAVGSFHEVGTPEEKKLVVRPLWDADPDLVRTDLQIKTPPGESLNEFDYVNVSQDAAAGLSWYLNHAFDDGSMWAKVPNKKDRTIDWSQLMPHVTGLVRLVPGTTSFQFLPETMQVFWNARDSGIDRLFDNVATSLTNSIRMTADNGTSLSGQQGVTTTYYVIRWPWAVVPCLTVVLSTVFLAIAILETRRMEIPVWKDSELPTLFNGFSGDVMNQTPSYKLRSEMEKGATGVHVRLVETERDFLLDGTVVGAEDDEIELRPAASRTEDEHEHEHEHRVSSDNASR